jgi:hypothetical protein
MKKPNILLIQHERNLSGINLALLRPVLELISCQVELCIFGNARQILPALTKDSPDLVIFDRPLLPASSLLLGKGLLGGEPFNCPQIFLSEEKDILRPSSGKTGAPEFPFDVIALHGLIGKHLFNYPRKHLMPAPSCIFSKGFYTFGEILSLGTGGAFIKAPCHHLRTGDLVDVSIPLLGTKRELEIRSRIIYSLMPMSENNYLQGIGVGFDSPDQETTRVLEDFLRLALLDEISPVFSCFGLPGPQAEAPKCPADSLAKANAQHQFRS